MDAETVRDQVEALREAVNRAFDEADRAARSHDPAARRTLAALWDVRRAADQLRRMLD